MARAATPVDLARVAALLASSGADVDEKSLRARLQTADNGILISPGGTLSWVLEDGSVHLYDIVADETALAELIDSVDSIAHDRSAVLLVSAHYGDRPVLAALQAVGFTVDYDEAEVEDGVVKRMITLIREVS